MSESEAQCVSAGISLRTSKKLAGVAGVIMLNVIKRLNLHFL